MAKKGELLPDAAKLWPKHLKKLKANEVAHWAYVETAIEIVQTRSYHAGGYDSPEEFMEKCCGWKKAWGYRLMARCQTRQNLSTIVDETCLTSQPAVLDEIGKLDKAKDQQQVFADVQEKCEAEDREPTASDYRKAVKAKQKETNQGDQGEKNLARPTEQSEPVSPPQQSTQVETESTEVDTPETCPRCMGSGQVPRGSMSKERFIPPTVEQVAEYCRERGNSVDAEAFVASYGAKGWKMGKTPMKNWQLAVITWEKSDESRNSKSDVEKLLQGFGDG